MSRWCGSIDVRTFGARGDGVTDDAPAFRRAVDSARQSGESVFVPNGRYALGEDRNQPFACVNLPAGTDLHGPGTLLFAQDVRDSVRLLRIATPDVTVRGISVDLSTAPGGTSFGVSIQAGAQRVLLTNLAIRGNPNRGGVQVIGGSGITIQLCQILDMAQNGVTLYGDGTGTGPVGVLIEDCHISASVQPVDCEPVNGALCTNVTIQRSHLVTLSDNYALTLYRSMSALVRDCTLRGSLFLTEATNARVENSLIDATGSEEHDAVEAFGKTAGCTLTGNVVAAAMNRVGINIARRASGRPQRISVRGNQVRVDGAAGTGIIVENAPYVDLIGNHVFGRHGQVGIDVGVPSLAVKQTMSVRDNTTEGFSSPVRTRLHVR